MTKLWGIPLSRASQKDRWTYLWLKSFEVAGCKVTGCEELEKNKGVFLSDTSPSLHTVSPQLISNGLTIAQIQSSRSRTAKGKHGISGLGTRTQQPSHLCPPHLWLYLPRLPSLYVPPSLLRVLNFQIRDYVWTSVGPQMPEIVSIIMREFTDVYNTFLGRGSLTFFLLSK